LGGGVVEKRTPNRGGKKRSRKFKNGKPPTFHDHLEKGGFEERERGRETRRRRASATVFPGGFPRRKKREREKKKGEGGGQ